MPSVVTPSNYDCVVFSTVTIEPFIHSVKDEYSNFCITYEDRKSYEEFSIAKYDVSVDSPLTVGTYLVANKARVSRDEVEKAIKRLRPKPVHEELN